jgi:DNA-binding NarL/FixJ family response regulator
MPVRVLLADDHRMVRQGVKSLLERAGFSVVAECADGLEAVRLAKDLNPDVGVIDLEMPGLNGLDAAREIQQAAPRTKTVLLTVHADEEYFFEAVRAGIRACVLKTYAIEDLIRAIEEVLRGDVYLSPSISRAVVDAYLGKIEPPTDPLTARERQVLQLIAEGRTTKETAQLLHLSVKAAESHRSRIMDKLDIHQTAGLVRYAIRRGLVQL